MTSDYRLQTPVAFIIFNRPDETRRVFRAIAAARPPRLLVVADGPRSEQEAERCEATRAVIREVDWDCEVLTNFSEKNLGCRERVSSGLDWVFHQSEEVIVVEDDCLPHPAFFPYCEDLLDKFRDDERVGMICGSNFDSSRNSSGNSYFFNLNVTAWGWASWRRVWQHYDVDMKLWQELRETDWLEKLLVNPVAVRYWKETFDFTASGEADTWDYQFFFTWWARNALAAIPRENLVSNIGFGTSSTHTRDTLPTMANLPVKSLSFPLRHPPDVLLDRDADLRAFRKICPWIEENQSYYWQLRHKVARAMPDPVRMSIRRLRARMQNAKSRKG